MFTNQVVDSPTEVLNPSLNQSPHISKRDISYLKSYNLRIYLLYLFRYDINLILWITGFHVHTLIFLCKYRIYSLIIIAYAIKIPNEFYDIFSARQCMGD